MFKWPCGCEIRIKTFVAITSRLIKYNAWTRWQMCLSVCTVFLYVVRDSCLVSVGFENGCFSVLVSKPTMGFLNQQGLIWYGK